MSAKRATFLTALCLIAGCVDGATVAGPPGIRATDQAETTLGPVSPLTGSADSATTLYAYNNGTVMLHGRWDVPLVFPIGQPLPAISAVIRDNTSTCPTCLDGDAVNMVLISSSSGQVAQVTSIGPNGSAASNGAAGTGPTQTLTIPASTRVAVPGELWMLQFQTLGLLNNPTSARDMIGMITVGTPPPPTTRLLYPPTVFSADASNPGVWLVSPDIISGATIVGASAAANCPSWGYIQTCTRRREGGAWDTCTPTVACSGKAVATLDAVQLVVTDTQHFDVGIRIVGSGNTPDIAVVSFF